MVPGGIFFLFVPEWKSLFKRRIQFEKAPLSLTLAGSLLHLIHHPVVKSELLIAVCKRGEVQALSALLGKSTMVDVISCVMLFGWKAEIL